MLKRDDCRAIAIHGVDARIGAEELEQRARKRAGAGAKIRPDAIRFADGVPDQVHGFTGVHEGPDPQAGYDRCEMSKSASKSRQLLLSLNMRSSLAGRAW